MSTWPDELTDSDRTGFKELVNLYDVKAGGLSVYRMLMYDMPAVQVKAVSYKDENSDLIYALFLHRFVPD